MRDYVWIGSPKTGGCALASSSLTGWPVWSPDGQAVAYVSSPDTSRDDLATHVLGSGAVEPVLEFDGARQEGLGHR